MKNMVTATLGAFLFVGASMAFAASGTLVEGVEKGINLVYYLKLLALATFYLAGLFLAGTGIWSMVKSMKPNSQENIGVAIGKFFLGVLLCILPSLIGLTANTFFDGSSSETSTAIKTKGDSF